jgi:tetratricopeptide (TPR) repeat protein
LLHLFTPPFSMFSHVVLIDHVNNILSYEGRPYADAMRKVYEKYPDDPEVAYCFAESLMVLNAWQLYEYPTGKAVSPDVDETRGVLEKSLAIHKGHAGLCHMYVHLSEMSGHPEMALEACEPLRHNFPQAGHLIHMPTHIDVLVGDYDKCVHYNCKAIEADERSMLNSPGTAGKESFYFGYIVHNFHMSCYGAILGGFEGKAMELSRKLNQALSEEMFEEYPDLTAYLEAYSALDVHVMIRFGRWRQLLELEPPRNKRLMLFRAASVRFGKALAHANLGDLESAKREANNFDSLRGDPDAAYRILHNNSVEHLLAVDSVMVRGEIAYREGKYEDAFDLLRKAVHMQDNLKYDEPWGKMQPIRHALGGLLLEQGHLEEAEEVFRKDLWLHPKNPWALVGLIAVLKKLQESTPGRCCTDNSSEEVEKLQEMLAEQRKVDLADVVIKVACACCHENDL